MEFLDEETVTIDQSEGVSEKDAAGKEGGGELVLAPSFSTESLAQGSAFPDNRLMTISSELLTLCVKLPSLPQPENLDEFRRRLFGQIHSLKVNGSHVDYPVDQIDKACFLFAIVIDEMILCSGWPDADLWANDSLLSKIFKVRNGGELFFTLTDRMLRQPKSYSELLELSFFFLSIGFQGKYRGEVTDAIFQMKNELKQQIDKYLPKNEVPFVYETDRPVPHSKVTRTRIGLISIAGLSLVALVYLGALTFLQANATSRGQQFIKVSAEIDKLPAAKWASRNKKQTEADAGAQF
jgi:type VI secretion system protein ImpK